MSITPSTPAENSQGGFKTWVSSQRKILDPRVKSWWKSTVWGAARGIAFNSSCWEEGKDFIGAGSAPVK
jgi:hypothetical protein